MPVTTPITQKFPDSPEKTDFMEWLRKRVAEKDFSNKFAHRVWFTIGVIFSQNDTMLRRKLETNALRTVEQVGVNFGDANHELGMVEDLLLKMSAWVLLDEFKKTKDEKQVRD